MQAERALTAEDLRQLLAGLDAVLEPLETLCQQMGWADEEGFVVLNPYNPLAKAWWELYHQREIYSVKLQNISVCP
jgi:hypothetical protein